MKITGKLNVIGLLDDLGVFTGTPGIEVVTDADSAVVIAGLTEDQCRELAPFFYERVTLTVEAA